MGFNLTAAIGGAAKRGSEILKEEREDALANSEEALKIFTTLGLPKATEYRQKARLKGEMFTKLSNAGFDSDRIAVIMKENEGSMNVIAKAKEALKGKEKTEINIIE